MTKYLAIKLIFFIVVSLPLVNCLLYRICFPPGTQTRKNGVEHTWKEWMWFSISSTGQTK